VLLQNKIWTKIMALIFKIVSRAIWEKAQSDGVFRGASIDLADGYIHMSDAAQAPETARLYFAGQTDLLLVAYDSDRFGSELKWEASRGGALFPHIFDTLDPAQALWVKDLPWRDGAHVFPAGLSV
jgi:uncharacterized protein (DUF952 family)